MSRKKKIIKWVLVIIWMSFIFYMSHQPGDISSSQSDLILKLLNLIGIKLNEYWSVYITFIVRKVAHFTEYYILYLLLYGAINNSGSNRKKYIYALLIVFIYACSDEFHQYFIPGRCMSIKDVFIDTSGGILSLVSILLFRRYKKFKK